MATIYLLNHCTIIAGDFFCTGVLDQLTYSECKSFARQRGLFFADASECVDQSPQCATIVALMGDCEAGRELKIEDVSINMLLVYIIK